MTSGTGAVETASTGCGVGVCVGLVLAGGGVGAVGVGAPPEQATSTESSERRTQGVTTAECAQIVAATPDRGGLTLGRGDATFTGLLDWD